MLFEWWDKYWFRPASLFNLAVCRVIIVGLQLYLVGNGFAKFTEPATRPEFLYEPLPILELFLWPFGAGYRPSMDVLVTIYWITFGSGLMALVGMVAKPSLWVFALGNIFLQAHVYSYGDYHHPEALMMISLVILAMSPAGKALSIDDYWKKRKSSSIGPWEYLRSLREKKSKYARWPLVLISVLIGLMYLDAGLSKIADSGLDWVNGYTLQYYVAQDVLRWGSELGAWLIRHHKILIALSVLTIVFETTFISVIFFPSLYVLFIPAGIMFHIGIYLVMRAPFFQLISLYSVFIPWEELLMRVETSYS